MANIIIRRKEENWNRYKDSLHKERKQLADDLKTGIFTKSQMNWSDCRNEEEQNKRVYDYERWKGKNEGKMRRWNEINREFKKHSEESKVHSIDDIRENKVKYD